MNRDEWNERYRAVPVLWPIAPGPFLGGELNGETPGVALDLGAGEGRNSIWLAERGWRVTAVDFSEVAVTRGRAHARDAGVGESITWVVEDLATFHPVVGGCDLVLSLFLHLPAGQRHVVLERAVKALAPGGLVLVVGYDCGNATEGNEGVPDPALLFSTEEIIDELDGLHVERSDRIRVGGAIDAIIRARRMR